MLIKLTNTLNSIVRRVLSIVKDGLKMWLPFENSEILGEDLTEDYDFTSGWSTLDTTVNDANTFTSDPDGGLYKTLVEVGKTYSLTIAGTTDASSGIRVGNANDSVEYYSTSSSGAFSDTAIFVATQTNVYIKNKAAGEATITTFKIQEVTQIAPDKSGNSNGATLYTGKALSFDGTDDSVDFTPIDLTGEFTIGIWFNVADALSDNGIYGDGTTADNVSIQASGQNFRFRINNSSTTFGFDSGSINTWYRLIITRDSSNLIKCYRDGVASTTTVTDSNTFSINNLGKGFTGWVYNGKASDFQIYDATWTQADVTFDYNNPQHLVTDRAASSIALSNLKGYWHLSEGAGSFAYNSAVALGSEEVTNGDFATGSTTSWTFVDSNASVVSFEGRDEVCKVDFTNTSTIYASQDCLNSGRFYKVNLDYYIPSSNTSADTVQIRLGNTSATSLINPELTSSDSWTNVSLYGVSTGSGIYIYSVSGSVGDKFYFDNVSVKEVSVGEISGATWVLRQATIPQLGLMDWSKPTIGSDVVTLISDPNDPTKDILGNLVRLREHSLNLDGIGYAEVDDDDTINPTDAITVECWIYWTDTSTDKGIVTKRTNNSDYMLCQTFPTKFAFYIGTTYRDSNTIGNGWNHIVGTYDRTTMRLYVNGSADQTLGNTSAIPNTADNLQIGRYDDNPLKSYSERIDDVRIYDRALSPDEIAQNHKAGLNQHKALSSFSDDFSSDYGF